MTLARRSFLRVLGLGAASAARPSEAARLAGVDMSGIGLASQVVGLYGAPDRAPLSQQEAEAADLKRLAWIAANGIPNAILASVAESKARPHTLDPDLAVNRSFSLVAKLSIQRQRDIGRAIIDVKRDAQRRVVQNAVRKATGLDWWWS